MPTDDHTRNCAYGRQAARQDIAAGDAFKLVARMRELAADDSGFGSGYLSALAMRLTVHPV